MVLFKGSSVDGCCADRTKLKYNWVHKRMWFWIDMVCKYARRIGWKSCIVTVQNDLACVFTTNSQSSIRNVSG